MSDKIHLITHIGPDLQYLLIVLYKENQGWLFRLVDNRGIILKEELGKETALIAEKQGKQWLVDYLGKT